VSDFLINPLNNIQQYSITQWQPIPYKLNTHGQELLVLLFSGDWHYDPVAFSALPVSLLLWPVTEASAVLWPFFQPIW
jgi:hypothetical protein